jgi:Tol biopolymer transport system component
MEAAMKRSSKLTVVAIVGLVACTSTGDGEPSAAGSSTEATSSAEPVAAGMIVFSQGEPGGVFTMAPDGSDRQQIRQGSCCPRVSRDGVVAITSFLGDRPVPATMELDGSGYSVLQFRDNTIQFNDPWTWSPDGKRIAGEGGNGEGGPEAGIYTLGSSGGRLVQVDATPGHREFPMAYSPDGSRILILRQVQRGDDYDGHMDVYVVNTDGSGSLRLNPPGIVSGFIDTPLPTTTSWSPDGRQVAFTAAKKTRGSFWDSDRAVFVVDVDGGRARRVTPWGNTYSAMWSPDGRWIAFSMEDPVSQDLFVVHPDGTGLAAITSSADGLFSFGPAWSPDSTKLLFVRGSDEFDTTDLWTVNVDGTDLVQITDSHDGYGSYSWVPTVGAGS